MARRSIPDDEHVAAVLKILDRNRSLRHQGAATKYVEAHPELVGHRKKSSVVRRLARKARDQDPESVPALLARLQTALEASLRLVQMILEQEQRRK